MKTLAHSSEPDPIAEARLSTVLQATAEGNYALYGSVWSPEMLSLLPKERFVSVCDTMKRWLETPYTLTYMGPILKSGVPVHFWRLSKPGWETELLVRMSLNRNQQISGLLYSDPFSSALGKK